MAFFDFSLAELESYRPKISEPADFDDFWQRTISEAKAKATAPWAESVSLGVNEFEVFDLTFSGYQGESVRAWWIKSHLKKGVIVEYNGYGGGRGLPSERLWWVAAGYDYFFMDTRGQGSAWGTGGVTPDPHGSAPAVAGFMTKGIEDKENYFYRRVFTDAVMLVEAASQLVPNQPIVVCGGSQGGGIALAVAGLSEKVTAALPDVPFLCHFERAVGLTDSYPYKEIADYLQIHRNKTSAVFATLSYFDGANFAKRAKAPALFSTALMDQVCPPSTVFAAKNLYAGQAQMRIYTYNGHEGGQGYQLLEQIRFLESVI